MIFVRGTGPCRCYRDNQICREFYLGNSSLTRRVMENMEFGRDRPREERNQRSSRVFKRYLRVTEIIRAIQRRTVSSPERRWIFPLV